MTDYEREYRVCDSVCGEPFAEFVDFFSAMPSGLSVLDLGCGQGRDALVAARHGHSVYGIDIAGSGVAQLAQQAEAAGYDLQCEVHDIEKFEADRQYDVVVLDRVLHMLPTVERRRAMLDRAKGWVALGGHVLVADTNANRELIRSCLCGHGWKTVLNRQDFLFVQRIGKAAPRGSVRTSTR